MRRLKRFYPTPELVFGPLFAGSPDIPDDADLVSVSYDAVRGALEVVISSKQFPELIEASQPPDFTATSHMVNAPQDS